MAAALSPASKPVVMEPNTVPPALERAGGVGNEAKVEWRARKAARLSVASVEILGYSFNRHD